MTRDEMVGSRFGVLTVVRQSPRNDGERRFWVCLCDCGNERTVRGYHLRMGHTKSCGCTRARHRATKSRAYTIWSGMKQRCYNPNERGFSDYGGRGIRVCKRWRDSFEAFLEDMGPPPVGMSIDRVDVNGNYAPGNCRWATPLQQQRNCRKTVMLTIGGKTMALGDWADEYGVNRRTVKGRLRRGLTPEQALRLPKQPGRNFRAFLDGETKT